MLRNDFPGENPPRILQVPHVIRGKTVFGLDQVYRSRDMDAEFATPALDADQLVWSRREAPPMLDMPIAQVMNFLEAVGERLDIDNNPALARAFEGMNRISALGPRILENTYRDMRLLFNRRMMEAEITASIGDPARLDGWVSHAPTGAPNRMRAFPPRLVHIMAGNAPQRCSTHHRPGGADQRRAFAQARIE